MEKENKGFTTNIGSFRKIYATIPEQLFIKLRDTDIIKPGRFDNFIVQAIFDRLVAEGHIQVEKASDKKPRKKKTVAEDDAV